MKKKIPRSKYVFTAKIWLYPGETANWHFVTVSKKDSASIQKKFVGLARGWGSFPVSVTIGKTTWQTSIFPDRKSGTYLLPLKKSVRTKEGLENGDTVTVALVMCP